MTSKIVVRVYRDSFGAVSEVRANHDAVVIDRQRGKLRLDADGILHRAQSLARIIGATLKNDLGTEPLAVCPKS